MKLFVFPGNIEDDILNIATKQVPYFRTQWFSDLLLDCEKRLLDLIDCPGGKIIPYTASGTAAMESCVSSISKNLSKKVLTIGGGTFGCRWGEICSSHGVPYDESPVSYGHFPDMKALKEKIYSGQYSIMTMPHNETLSGTLYDIKTISEWCHANDMLYLVDPISSFLADDFSMRRHGVDIATLSTQKGLTLPPGMSFVVLSPAALERMSANSNGFYYDWPKHLSSYNLPRGQTPFSPATHLLMQLQERLKRIEKSGIKSCINYVANRAEAFRSKIREFGWEFTAKDTMSNCITGVFLPYEARPVVDYLANKGIFIIPSQNKPPFNRMVRVAHLGCLTQQDDIELAMELKKWEKMGK